MAEPNLLQIPPDRTKSISSLDTAPEAKNASSPIASTRSPLQPDKKKSNLAENKIL